MQWHRAQSLPRVAFCACVALMVLPVASAGAASPALTEALLTHDLLAGTASRAVVPIAKTATASGGPMVKVATIEFGPEEGNVAGNRAHMVALATEAGEHGAKMIVLPEMATSGYSFFSRAEIAHVAETVPGPSTEAMGEVARRFGAYIAFGMPEYEPKRDLYYNVAVLMGPEGNVVGKYRKRNNLLEASYNAEVYEPMPTFETPYGRIALAICSDIFYPQFAREAAVEGATVLLAPANTGLETRLAQVRTYENDMSLVVANRYGVGSAGTEPESFNQNTFTIPSPFRYEWEYEDQSMIMNEKKRTPDRSDRTERRHRLRRTAGALREDASGGTQAAHVLADRSRHAGGIHPDAAWPALSDHVLGGGGQPGHELFAVGGHAGGCRKSKVQR